MSDTTAAGPSRRPCPSPPAGEGMRMAGPTTPVRSRSVRTRGNRGTTPPPPGRRRLGGITGTFWSFRTGNGSRSDPGAWPAAWRPAAGDGYTSWVVLKDPTQQTSPPTFRIRCHLRGTGLGDGLRFGQRHLAGFGGDLHTTAQAGAFAHVPPETRSDSAACTPHWPRSRRTAESRLFRSSPSGYARRCRRV